jgi:hypothetical protein
VYLCRNFDSIQLQTNKQERKHSYAKHTHVTSTPSNDSLAVARYERAHPPSILQRVLKFGDRDGANVLGIDSSLGQCILKWYDLRIRNLIYVKLRQSSQMKNRKFCIVISGLQVLPFDYIFAIANRASHQEYTHVRLKQIVEIDGRIEVGLLSSKQRSRTGAMFVCNLRLRKSKRCSSQYNGFKHEDSHPRVPNKALLKESQNPIYSLRNIDLYPKPTVFVGPEPCI